MILLQSSRLLTPITLLASLKFSIGGIALEPPVAKRSLSYFSSLPFESLTDLFLISIPIAFVFVIHFILLSLKKLPCMKFKDSSVLFCPI